jgi:iron complex transport system substrate-binding protein
VATRFAPLRRRLGVGLIVLLALLPGAAAPAAASAVVVVDALGREVRFSAPARRIVSLAPNLTEIVFALGLGDRLVGVTDFCDYPPAARQVARVGGITGPSAEQIVALAPDLVLATTAGNGKEQVLGLARLGLRVVVTDPKDLASVADSFVLVARAAGVPEAGARVAAEFRRRLDAVRRAVAGLPRPRTLLLVWPDPLIAAGPRTFPSRLLEAAGGTNALAVEWSAAYPTIGLESLLAIAPDAIVLAAHQGTTLEALARLSRYGDVPAIRDGRLAVIDQAILARPGPRLADAAEQLTRLLHGALPRENQGAGASNGGPRP